MRTGTALCALLLAGPLAVAFATSAAAEPPPAERPLAFTAVAELWPAVYTPTAATVCARGWVDDGAPVVGEWTFHVVGATSTFTDVRGGATYPTTCFGFTTGAVPAGTTEATVTYVGAGGDPLADCTATLTWAPGVRLTWVDGCMATTPTT